MLRPGLLAAALSSAISVGGAFAADVGAQDVAPTGSLRVAIAVGPAASAFWATRDAATGKPGGVAVELAKAAAGRLHVPLQLVEYLSSDDIATAGAKDAWDISFMPSRRGARSSSTAVRPTSPIPAIICCAPAPISVRSPTSIAPARKSVASIAVSPANQVSALAT
jgi:ABC-type amino acid transport substrate-binding protein